jgi:flagellar biogenesis protein FliO
MKKRIALLTGLLAMSIVGQLLLRPCLGDETDNDRVTISSDQDKISSLIDPNVLFQEVRDDSGTDGLQGQLYKQLIKMIVFVGIIGAGVWFYCKKMPGRWNLAKGKDIVVTETVNLGPRKLLHIVQVGAKQYLLSSTPDSIRLLADVTESLEHSHE